MTIWKTVPVEPTEEMCAATDDIRPVMGTPERLADPEHVRRFREKQHEANADTYRAMLAAAPPPPEQAEPTLRAKDVAKAIRWHTKDWEDAAQNGVEGSRIGAGAIRGVLNQIASLLPPEHRDAFLKIAGGGKP